MVISTNVDLDVSHSNSNSREAPSVPSSQRLTGQRTILVDEVTRSTDHLAVHLSVPRESERVSTLEEFLRNWSIYIGARTSLPREGSIKYYSKVSNGIARPMAREWPMPLMSVVDLSTRPEASNLRIRKTCELS